MKEELKKVYIPMDIESAELCHPINSDDFDTITDRITGKTRHEPWVPIKMKIVNDDEGKHLSYSDSPWIGTTSLIFRSNVINVMGEMLALYGDLLPIYVGNEQLFFYDPLPLENILDIEKSKVRRLSDGQILMIQEYKFRSELMSNCVAFRINDLVASPIFVNNLFVECWMKYNFKGLKFKEVWNDNGTN